MATNGSFRDIALSRGGMAAEDVFVVRSAPKIETFKPGPGNPELRKGAGTVMGYVGVIGQQEGMDLLVLAAEHLIRALGKADVHFLIVGFGPTLDEVRRDVADSGSRGIFHLYRCALRGRPARRIERDRYRRVAGPEEPDERHLDDEQGHGIHDP